MTKADQPKTGAKAKEPAWRDRAIVATHNGQCKLDHTDPETLPRFLCRACNPHLIPTPDANAAFYDALRQSQAQAAEINRLAREIAATAGKIERMEARGQNRWGKVAIDPTSVEGKIHAGLTRKLERLQNEHKTRVT